MSEPLQLPQTQGGPECQDPRPHIDIDSTPALLTPD